MLDADWVDCLSDWELGNCRRCGKELRSHPDTKTPKSKAKWEFICGDCLTPEESVSVLKDILREMMTGEGPDEEDV